MGLFVHKDGGYQPRGALTPGYGAFPHENGAPAPPAPRAAAYVLTTEHAPHPGYPALAPLHWLDRERNGSRDFLLMTSPGEVQTAINAGYVYRGLQGYVYQICAPEPGCIPPGAEKLWRLCKPNVDDCAVFLERERAWFQQQGYSVNWPPQGNPVLGYAYPVVDTDGDGLVDGFEYILTTNRLSPDSDRDGIPDGVEYPQAGIPRSDPCSEGYCGEEFIFSNSFE